MLPQGLNINVVLNIFLQLMILCCSLMSTEDVMSPEVEDTSEAHEERAPVPTTNDFVLLYFRWSTVTCVL